jgi:hypothetical protein
MEISAYDIKAYDIHIYCKLSEAFKDTSNYICTISFGSKHNQFCLTALYKQTNPKEIYIDRVQHNDQCVVDGSLQDFKNGTIKIVSTALWFMKNHFKEVERFTLNDDSHIECERGKAVYKLRLAYDYILKYNQTWYENKFNAVLPSIGDDSLYDKYKKSLSILDAPLYPYSIVKDRFMSQDYEEIYNLSSSPRDFLDRLRKTLGTNYCFNVAKWLHNYMLFLQINLYQTEWCIMKDTITKPEGYIQTPLDTTLKNKLFVVGGGRRKHTRKRYTYRLINSTYNDGNIVGVYGEI